MDDQGAHGGTLNEQGEEDHTKGQRQDKVARVEVIGQAQGGGQGNRRSQPGPHAGVQIGLPRYIAAELVTQTVLGAARLAQESARHPAALKNAVTSPGGTAAAALYQLEKGGLRPTMADAVMAAYQRSIALGQADARAAQDVVRGRRTTF